jgi:hypothetical protein
MLQCYSGIFEEFDYRDYHLKNNESLLKTQSQFF